jgi:hypothetical protein
MPFLHSLAAVTIAAVVGAVSLVGVSHRAPQGDAGAFGGRSFAVSPLYREPASHRTVELQRVRCAGGRTAALCFASAPRR